MKHEDIYYTCDRCGKRIGKDIPSERSGLIRRWSKRLNMLNKADIEFITENAFGYISRAFMTTHPIANAEIVESVESRSVHYCLCGKCRKEFEKFMKNR